MNRYNRGVLVGLILGDGCLRSFNHDTNNSIRNVLIMEHSIKQLDYLEHKRNKIHSIFGGKSPKIHKVNTKLSNGVTYECVQYTKQHKYFKLLRKWMYPGGTKTYTRRILDMLNPEGLCYWYLDDGHAKACHRKSDGTISSISLTIATHCSLEEALIIQKYFKDTWDILVKVYEYKPNSTYNIRFNTNNGNKFLKLISKFIPDSMKYKDLSIHKSAEHLNKDDDIV